MREDRDSLFADSDWDPASFATGLLLGAAVGAGLALLFAPAAGEDTRRVIRRRARAARRDAGKTWIAGRKEARRLLRERKEALSRRVKEALD